MTDYLDRLERELVTAGRRDRTRPARPSGFRGARRRQLSPMVPVIISLAVTAIVLAVVLATGIIHGSAQSATGHHGHGPVTTPAPVAPKVTTAPACRLPGRPRRPPAPRSTGAAPSASLSSILSIARDPASGNGSAAIRGFERDAIVHVLTVFRRYIWVVTGERGARLAVFPAIFCNQTSHGKRPLGSPISIDPEQAMMVAVLGYNPPSLVFGGATAATITRGSAVFGRTLPNGQWMDAAVVPDGVAKVVMRFTPPFLHHYSATATVHDNVGIVARRVPYDPTSVLWYDSAGHHIHTYVDWADLRYENCLAAHRKNCH